MFEQSAEATELAMSVWKAAYDRFKRRDLDEINEQRRAQLRKNERKRQLRKVGNYHILG